MKRQKETCRPGSAKRANMLQRLVATMLIVGVLISQANAQQTGPATGVAKVHEGALLKLATLSPLDPSTAKRGDDVPLVLTRPFEVDGVTLLAAGEIVHGTVTSTKKAGKKCKQSEIKWKVDQITFHDGTVIHTKIMLKSKNPNASIPSAAVIFPTPLPDRVGEVGEAVMWSPVLAALLIEEGIKAPFRHNACSQYTTDLPLPANATIGVEIMENHAVRY